jgi:hypothetical protein
MKKILIVILLWGMAFCPSQASDQAGTELNRPPLPSEGIKVIAPDPSLPSDLKVFSGSWDGLWLDPHHPDEPIREILVVEEVISKDDIRGIFSWGDCSVCQSKADWRRFSGKLLKLCIDWGKLPAPFNRVDATGSGEKKVLYFRYAEGRTFSFVLDDKDQLIGTDGTGLITMSRFK